MAGTDSGILLSTNLGTTWQFAGLPYNCIRSILVVNESVALTSVWYDEEERSGLLYRTSDRGQTWNLLRQGDGDIRSLEIANNGNIVFASYGSTSPGIYYSTDQGLTWNASDFTNHFMYYLAVNRNTGRLFASCGGTIKIVTSTNDGLNWTPCSSFSFYQEPADIFVTPRGTVIIDGYCRSTDNGLTWTITDSGLYEDLIIRVTTTSDTGTLFATTFDTHLVQSNDDGLHWNPVTSHSDVAETVYGDASYLFTSGANTYRSTNGGIGWTVSSFAIFGYASDENIFYRRRFMSDGFAFSSILPAFLDNM